MSRESNDGFVCPKCEETIYREQCGCLNNYQPPCEHLNRRINLSTCRVECLDCGEALLDLDPLVPRSLRVARNLP